MKNKLSRKDNLFKNTSPKLLKLNMSTMIDPSATENHLAANLIGDNARTSMSITILRQTKR